MSAYTRPQTLAELQSTLQEMHSYRRPSGSAVEREFIARYLLPFGPDEDEHGNLILHVPCKDGTRSRVLWSSHTDTVHRTEGRQSTRINSFGVMRLARKSKANCLGADDTVGVYLMVQMLRAHVPGTYVFHFGEEIGCVGSDAIAFDRPAWIRKLDYAIAFDRKGTDEVITYQCGERTASDAFAKSFARQMNAHGLKYRPSDRGVFTDTERYAEFLPECTNISVGYDAQHSSAETVDTLHVYKLLHAMLAFDESLLVCKRKPGPPERRKALFSGRRAQQSFNILQTTDQTILDIIEEMDDRDAEDLTIEVEDQMLAFGIDVETAEDDDYDAVLRFLMDGRKGRTRRW